MTGDEKTITAALFSVPACLLAAAIATGNQILIGLAAACVLAAVTLWRIA